MRIRTVDIREWQTRELYRPSAQDRNMILMLNGYPPVCEHAFNFHRPDFAFDHCRLNYQKKNGVTPFSLLTEKEVRDMKRLYRKGLSNREVWRKYSKKVSYRHVRNILEGRSWAWIK